MPPTVNTSRINRVALYCVAAGVIVTLLLQTVTILYGEVLVRREEDSEMAVMKRVLEKVSDHGRRIEVLERRR